MVFMVVNAGLNPLVILRKHLMGLCCCRPGCMQLKSIRRKFRQNKVSAVEATHPLGAPEIRVIPPGPKKRGVRRASYLPNRNFNHSDILTQSLYGYSFEESRVSAL
eukprot:sb/3477777/